MGQLVMNDRIRNIFLSLKGGIRGDVCEPDRYEESKKENLLKFKANATLSVTKALHCVTHVTNVTRYITNPPPRTKKLDDGRSALP